MATAIDEEKPEGQKDEDIKKLIQECNAKIAQLRKQLDAAYNEKKHLLQKLKREGKLAVDISQDEIIQQLTRQVDKVTITNDKLQKIIEKLRSEKYAAEKKTWELEAEKNKEIEKLQQEIHELKNDIQRAQSMYEEEFKEGLQCYYNLKGQVCNFNCAVRSLVWICKEKLQINPCGPHLRTLITTTAERERGPINNIFLRCEAFMHMLILCEVVEVYYSKEFTDNVDRDKAWRKLNEMDHKKQAVMIGRVKPRVGQVGHCVVCDLESRQNGTLEIHDPQEVRQDFRKITCRKQEQFRKYVADDRKIILFTVKFEKLLEVINNGKEIVLHEQCKLNSTDATKTSIQYMLPAIEDMKVFPVKSNISLNTGDAIPTLDISKPATLKMLPDDTETTTQNMLP